MTTSISNTEGVEEQQHPSVTVEKLYAATKTAVKAGNLEAVQRLLHQWRSNPSIPNPTPQDVNYLVPQAAENDGQPAILKYLLTQGGKIRRLHNRANHLSSHLPDLHKPRLETGQ